MTGGNDMELQTQSETVSLYDDTKSLISAKDLEDQPVFTLRRKWSLKKKMIVIGIILIFVSGGVAAGLLYATGKFNSNNDSTHPGPSQDDPRVLALTSHFPNALSTKDAFNFIRRAVPYDPQDVLFGLSVCSDEINHETNDLSEKLRSFYGSYFDLGGLAGIPYPGRTGFTAYKHHAPHGSHMLVVYGPHVGISIDGDIGLYNRAHFHEASAACGAAIGAYKQLAPFNGSTTVQFNVTRYDEEYSLLVQQLTPLMSSLLYDNSTGRLQARSNQQIQALLPRKIFEITQQYANVLASDFLSTAPEQADLTLIGGIVINVSNDHDHAFMEDYFMPISTQIITPRSVDE